MKVFVTTNHDVHYPVGAASVVLARSEREAKTLLDAALVARGLKPSDEHPYTLEELDDSPQAQILVNGDY